MSEFETVFRYSTGKGTSYKGTKKVKDDGISVDFSQRYKGKCVHGVFTTVDNEDNMRVFFYDKLKSNLNGSWLIMDTIIRQETEKFHKRMKKIEKQIPAAVIKKYEEILGPLENINQMVINKAIVELRRICDSWHK